MMYIRLYMDLSTDNKSFNLTFGKVSRCFLLSSGPLIFTADWRCSVTSLWCCNAHVSWCNRYHYVRHWSEPCVCSLLMFLFSKRFPKQWRIQDLVRVLPKSARKWKKLDRKGGRTPPGSADEKYGNISLLIQMSPSTTTPLESQRNVRLILRVSFLFAELNTFLNF